MSNQALPANETRQANGQFGKGNPGGPGNPFGRQVAAYRKAFQQELPEEDMCQLLRAMWNEGCKGNAAAARIVFDYVVGKPSKTKDPDRIDIDEFEVAKGKRIPPKEAVTALIDTPIEEAIEMASSIPEMFDDPEEARLDAEEEAAEAAAALGHVEGYEPSAEAIAQARKCDVQAEALRMTAHVLRHGTYPKDSCFGTLEAKVPAGRMDEYRDWVGHCLRDGTLHAWPFAPLGDGEPIEPLSDGDAAPAEARQEAVCAVG